MGGVLIDRLHSLASRGAMAAPATEPCKPAAVDVSDLSEGERCALMQMSIRGSVQALSMKLREQYSTPPFTLSTFIRLRELGLATKPTGAKFHSLTWAGAQLAEQIANQIIRERSIHTAYLSGTYGKWVTVRCVCGWSTNVIRNPREQLAAAERFSNHLRHVEEATKAREQEMKTALVPICQGIEQV